MRVLHALPLLIPVASLAAGQFAGGNVFAFTDSQGIVHYSNVPADTRFELVLAAPREGQGPVPSLQRSAAYSHIIDGAALANRLEPALVTAVILAESGGDPRAVSKRGAGGLMQLMPATARQYGVQNVFDPEQNIRAGTRYLHDLAERYKNDLELMLAAYNAGPDAVDRQGGRIPPFRETLDYVPRVLQIYHKLLDLTQEP
ncbi:MAG: lytic transglycosylase domain-containing protein [Steroidobacteraceae bacterium]